MDDSLTVSEHILNHLLKGEAGKATDLIHQHLATEQNNPEFLYVAARTARELRDLTAAKQLVGRLLALAGDDGNVHELAYKIAYDDGNLDGMLRHIALGAGLPPDQPWMKQLALQQICTNRQYDSVFEQLCRSLLETPQAPESYWRTASLLAGAKLYDAALVFLKRAQIAQATTADPVITAQAITNDIGAVECLKAGQPISFPAYDNDEWRAVLQHMAPCPVDAAYTGPAATIIVTSHFSTKLALNAHKAPPSTQLLRETLASFRQHAAMPPHWPMIICFDAPATEQPAAEAEYVAGLEQVAREYNATVRTYRAAGLRRVFLDVFRDITTPYFMMLEHDWVCARAVEPLPAIAAMMDSNLFVHHVRYPRHHNHINATDWYLMPEHRVGNVPLLAGPAYSNNPSLTRTAKFARDWLPLITQETPVDRQNDGAGGVEETILQNSFHLMRHWGIYANMMAHGVYVLGRPNDPPRIDHTGI